MTATLRPPVPAADFRPVRLAEIELSAPLAPLPDDPAGRWGHVSALVRLHGRPVGVVDLPTGAGPDAQEQAAERTLGPEIRRHRAADGPAGGTPACTARRARLLAGPPPVTVLVATRDRTRELGACLDSLLAQDYPGAYDVVVVDSAPASDATERYLTHRFAGDRRVRYVRTPTPGLAVAHNHGLPAVTGEITAITDDDVVVDGQWLSAIAEAFRATPGTACVTGLILPVELQTPAQALLEQYGGFARGFRRRVYALDAAPADDPLFPYTAGRLGSGANMAFDTGALRALGGFDPALGAGTPARGGDDLAAFVQVLLAGHTLVYEPAAIVRHRHRRDYAGLLAMAQGYGVGLGAYLSSLVASRPSLLADMVRKGPRALSYVLRADSAKNRHKGAAYPRALTRTERLGMVRGPLAYLASRRRPA
jgi:glycosyltransferase involved in cell wall biosynthesis